MSGIQFGQEMLDAIFDGHKTVTRRPVKKNSDGSEKPCRFKVGRTYSIQPGRGKKAVGRVKIKWTPHQELLGQISIDRALKEGFGDAAEFVDYWIKLYGGFDPYETVWVIEFELVAA